MTDKPQEEEEQQQQQPPSPIIAGRADARAAARAPLASLKPLRLLGSGGFAQVDLVSLPSPRSGGCAVSGGRTAALKRIKVRRRASTTGATAAAAPDGGSGGGGGGGAGQPPTPRTAATMLRSEREAHERAGGCAFVAHAFALKQGRPAQPPRPLTPKAAAAGAAPSSPPPSPRAANLQTTTATTTTTTPPPPPQPPPQNLALLLEYHPGGDLAQLLARRRADYPASATRPYLDEGEARFVAACALVALESLHRGRCIHRDVKPGNLFVSRGGYAVLGDLGCAAVLPRAVAPAPPLVGAAAAAAAPFAPPAVATAAAAAAAAAAPAWCIYRGRHCSAVSGTRGYMAPEVARAAGPSAAKSYGAAADLFSLGVVLFELAAGERPPIAAAAAAGKNTKAAAAGEGAVGDQPPEPPPLPFPAFPPHFSAGLRSLLSALLSSDPLGRPTAAEAQASPWFSGFDWAALRGRTMAPPAALMAAAAAAAELS